MNIAGLIYAISAAVTWGLVYTIDQRVLSKVSPLSLLFVSSLIVVIITLPIFLFDFGSIKTLMASGKTNLWLILISVILGTLANFFIFSAIKGLGASTAAIFEISYPVFVVLFGFLFFKISLNPYFFIGSILIFIGSIVIIKFA